ncbi:MAG: hypothetical protein ACI8WB_003484, partial [Phenylobacterium sp.]
SVGISPNFPFNSYVFGLKTGHLLVMWSTLRILWLGVKFFMWVRGDVLFEGEAFRRESIQKCVMLASILV